MANIEIHPYWFFFGFFCFFCFFFFFSFLTGLLPIGPRREKTCHPGFRQCEFEISLLSYRDNLGN